MVAEGCGISPRYLSHLLKNNGSPFLALVWNRRLQVANEWLSSTTSSEISISEIAFRVGFKSPSHFSRLFKREFRRSPRENRCSAKIDIGNPNAGVIQ
jgi:AraC-like DNA-binding protein